MLLLFALMFFEGQKPPQDSGVWAAVVTVIGAVVVFLLEWLWLRDRFEKHKNALQEGIEQKKIELQASLEEKKTELQDSLEEKKADLQARLIEVQHRVSEQMAEFTQEIVREGERYKKQLEEEMGDVRKRREELERVQNAASSVNIKVNDLMKVAMVTYKKEDSYHLNLMDVAHKAFNAMVQYRIVASECGRPRDRQIFDELQQGILTLFLNLSFDEGGKPDYVKDLTSAMAQFTISYQKLDQYCDEERHKALLHVGSRPDRQLSAGA